MSLSIKMSSYFYVSLLFSNFFICITVVVLFCVKYIYLYILRLKRVVDITVYVYTGHGVIIVVSTIFEYR